MHTGIKIFITLAAICSLFSISSAAIGSASYFEQHTSSVCFGDESRGVDVVAVNPAVFNAKDVCGKQMGVTCVGGAKCKSTKKIMVKIVNVCPPHICPRDDDISLSKEAFTKIADINAEKNLPD
ncbi:putative rlpA-like protein, double-psi beta-barrel [Heracleum sosnowskyi]|uniref:RlpA-like protein, double-psi beta-barrel n=1 Tax=Heracleum sosnowskyi TaxID=360622 RepID=A0AAD8H6N4_9APIA|nr:putative rlpA-like protein, double-psi beta-barrel [Heracleum sosnowskyi]